ncbi:aroma-sacti cluster domain-containing protein [Actinoplanes sp. N902-109]|uniref:aroma-sacti cluster domain-containing protein n=1 Tax=Actinoplanes sp. (strain N902-109) TaxID=649831 RepID=UPI0003294E2B|nr:aroma-sacti cluster domain-containing protein [Actinoplanes sp. N902-109]AGL17737.1 hypothetical protein L083_4227 [Actinoplanes sp. N902-109]
MHDALAALRAAGCPVDQLSTPQRDVLAALTEDETRVLVAVQHRLSEAEDEVTAHDLKLL